MTFKKIVPYKLIPMLAIAAAPMFTSCSNDDEHEVPQHDVELTFENLDASNILTIDGESRTISPTLKKHINDASVRTIYLIPLPGGWDGCGPNSIKGWRNNVLQICTNASPKVRGKGNFNFIPGAASKVPDDSLWFVRNGWTINKQLQK